MNDEDVKTAGLQQGQLVDLTSYLRMRSERAAFHGGALRICAWLHCDLFSRSQCARADQQCGRAIEYADEQVRDHFNCPSPDAEIASRKFSAANSD